MQGEDEERGNLAAPLSSIDFFTYLPIFAYLSTDLVIYFPKAVRKFLE